MHRKRKVDKKSCVTPAGISNELDVQNKWEENTHTNTTHAHIHRNILEELHRSIDSNYWTGQKDHWPLRMAYNSRSWQLRIDYFIEDE